MAIDYKVDIERIIAILQNNTAIYDVVNPAGKLHTIQFGEDSYKTNDGDLPYALVTTADRPFATKDQFGIGDGSSDSQNTVQYVIKVFAENGVPQDAEKELYDFVKEIVSTLKANPRLKEPVALNDPKCIRSFIAEVQPNPDKRGQEIQGANIVIQCQVGSDLQMTLPGPLTIDLLSIPNSPEGFNFDENLTDEQKRYVDTTNDRGTFLLEYENTTANETAVLALLGTTSNITLIKRGNSRVIKVTFIENNPTVRFDEIERAILHVEKTN